MESGGGGDGGGVGVGEGVATAMEDRRETVRHGGRMVVLVRRRVSLRRWRVAIVEDLNDLKAVRSDSGES